MASPTAHPALHSPTWVPVLADHFESTGRNVAALLQEAGFKNGVPGTKATKVPFGNIAALFELAADRCDDDLLGFHVGQKVDVRDAGLVAYVGINAPTVRDFVRNIAAYARVYSDAVEYDLSLFEDGGQMTWYYHLPPSIPRRQYVECAAVICVSALRQITKAPIWCDSVSFIHPRNAHIEEIERFFGCGASFGRRSNTISFKIADLDCPIVDADEKLLRLLKEIATEALNSAGTNRPELQEEVEKAILARLSSGDVGANSIAMDLGMSVRTLSRRLAEIDLSYSFLLVNLREALATRYIQDSDLSLTQIAFLLGYADSSSFSTAYRSWTGRPPSDVRRP